MSEKSVFEVLSKISVKDHIKETNGQAYLPWAWAWQQVKSNFPNATYMVVHDDETGLPFREDHMLGLIVETKVSINDETLSMWLPVMDNKFKAMKREEYSYETKFGPKSVSPANMHDINRAIMRCLTKNFAMFGLGISLYTGEEFEDSEPSNSKQTAKASSPAKSKTTTKKESRELPELTADSKQEWKAALEYLAKNKNEDGSNFEQLVKNLRTRKSISKESEKDLKNQYDRS